MSFLESLNLARERIASAEAVLIGAGAGLSTTAGLQYGGERFVQDDGWYEGRDRYAQFLKDTKDASLYSPQLMKATHHQGKKCRHRRWHHGEQCHGKLWQRREPNQSPEHEPEKAPSPGPKPGEGIQERV